MSLEIDRGGSATRNPPYVRGSVPSRAEWSTKVRRPGSAKRTRLLPAEIVDDRRGGPGADDAGELFAGRAADAGQAAERRQQRAPAAGTDAGDAVELGAQVAHRARLAMERDSEAVR